MRRGDGSKPVEGTRLPEMTIQHPRSVPAELRGVHGRVQIMIGRLIAGPSPSPFRFAQGRSLRLECCCIAGVAWPDASTYCGQEKSRV